MSWRIKPRAKLAIPDDWDGLEYECNCIEYPASDQWRAIMRGMVLFLQRARNWDEATGSVIDAAAEGRKIGYSFFLSDPETGEDRLSCIDEILQKLDELQIGGEPCESCDDSLVWDIFQEVVSDCLIPTLIIGGSTPVQDPIVRHYTQTRRPGTVTQGGVSGGASWDNPTLARFPDSNPAEAVIDFTGLSQTLTDGLNPSNFGFSVPTGALINGVTLRINRQTNITGQAKDIVIRLRTSAGTVGDNLSKVELWDEIGPFPEVVYGGSSTLWGLELSPSDVNNALFGCRLVAERANGDPICYVDAFEITVHYSLEWDEPNRTPGGCLIEDEPPDTQVIGVGDPPPGYESWDEYRDRLCRVAQMVIDGIIDGAKKFDDMALLGVAVIPLIIALIFAGSTVLAFPIALAALIIGALVAISRSSAHVGWADRIEAVKFDLVCALVGANTVGEARFLVDQVINTVYQAQIAEERVFLRQALNTASLNKLYWSNLEIDIPPEYLDSYCDTCDPPPDFGNFPFFVVEDCEFPDAIPEGWSTSSGTWGESGGTSDARLLNNGEVCGEPQFPLNVSNWCSQCNWCIDGFRGGTSAGQVKSPPWTPDADYHVKFIARRVGSLFATHCQTRVYQNGELDGDWINVKTEAGGTSDCDTDVAFTYVASTATGQFPKYLFEEGNTYQFEFSGRDWLFGNIQPELVES